MTRPIFEPNTQRTDAFLDFQQQQLFRRPAPAGGATEIKSFTATMLNDNFGIEVVTPGQSHIYWDTATNRNPECFEEQNDFTSPPLYDKLRILEDGVYTVKISADLGSALAYGTANVADALYRYDTVRYASKTWSYNSTQGYADIHDSWTFEMDGTAGSNRAIGPVFSNFHAAIAGTDDNIEISGLEFAVYKWPGTITL